jgi:hypothetical protein
MERMRSSFFEQRTREVRGRVDGELDPVGARRNSFGELAR